ncbi:VIT1/CCC1 transporter family protein [Microbacteriaceae bacterium]|nr:VIT1/CCC1 transporter family protein [Candidatus Saccharibacteria bacterium]
MSQLSPRRNIPFGADRFLALFEGVEGGFAIGAGILAGLSLTNVDRKTLIAIAAISVIINGFNSAAVKYSSEHYMDEIDGIENEKPFSDYFIPALIQFLSYFAISFISLIPLLILNSVPYAIFYSCAITLIILLAAGTWRAYILGMPRWRDGLEIAFLGACIIAAGFTSGWIIHIILKA